MSLPKLRAGNFLPSIRLLIVTQMSCKYAARTLQQFGANKLQYCKLMTMAASVAARALGVVGVGSQLVLVGLAGVVVVEEVVDGRLGRCG